MHILKCISDVNSSVFVQNRWKKKFRLSTGSCKCTSLTSKDHHWRCHAVFMTMGPLHTCQDLLTYLLKCQTCAHSTHQRCCSPECWTGNASHCLLWPWKLEKTDLLTHFTNSATRVCHNFIMVALSNRADHYIFALLFLSSIFFFSSPNLSGRRLDVYHTLTHGVALVRI